MRCAVTDERLLKSTLAKLLESGSHAVIESVISNGLPQNIAGNDGTTLLHFASQYNKLKIIKFLSDFGCDVNVKNSSGMTPLMFAVKYGRLEATKLLLENNANIFAVNSDGKNVLCMLRTTASNEKLSFLKCFLDKMKESGLEISDIVKSLNSANCTLTEIVCFQDSQLTRAFLQGNSLNSTDSHQSMHNTMVASKMQQVQTLLTHGQFFKKRRMYFLKCILLVTTKWKAGSLLKIESFTRQILHWNAFSKNEILMIEHILKKANEESMRILLRSGIISHVKQRSNRDVFINIFGNANPGIVDLMQNLKFDVNARGFNGQTALHVAVQNKLADNVAFLLKKGADPNAKDDDGETPMFETLWTPKNPNLSVKCLELLLLNGADIQAYDNSGVSFICYAARTMNVTSDLLELALTHLALREVMGLAIKQLIYDQIDVRDRLRNLFQSCRDKLGRITDHKINDNLTMFSMIMKSTENLCRCLNINDCQTIANFLDEQNNTHNRFYDNILRDRLTRVVKMHDLKGKAKIVIFESIEALRPYDLVIEKIVSFFNYKDLTFFE